MAESLWVGSVGGICNALFSRWEGWSILETI